MGTLTDTNVLILATNGFEQSELERPKADLTEAGATVHVATLDGKPIKGWDGDDWGDSVDADLKLEDVSVDDYAALVLPGGQINPDLLRVEPSVIGLVQSFVRTGRIVGAICHAPWLLIEADVVKDREMTSYTSIRTDLKNAGANVVDKAVAVSNGIVTSRNPGDLDAFSSKIIEEINEGRHARRAAK